MLAIYERHVDDVHRYAWRLTAGSRFRTEELVQETFLTLVRQVRDGSIDRVDIGWLITTCRHRFLDDIRRTTRAEARERRAVAGRPATTSEPDSGNTAHALSSLPPDQRLAMVLRYVDDLAITDVATAMRRSVGSVESLLQRAKRSLRQALAEFDADEQERTR